MVAQVTIVRLIYSLITYLILPVIALRLGWAMVRNPDYRVRWPERFGFVPTRAGESRLVWVHAVSVGEVQAVVPLITRLLDSHPENRILVTTMTPTGARTVEQRFGASVLHHYLPYDIPSAVRRFIQRLQPAILIVVETEIWPNLFHHCRRQGVPVLLVNARLSKRSAAAYARFPAFIRATLAEVNLIAAQSKADARRLQALGADPARIAVIGNLKFDIRAAHSVNEQAQVLRRSLSVNRPIWIAASTHEGEEKLVLDAFEAVLRRHADCLLLLAPRHPERFERVAELCRRRGFTVARHSHGKPVSVDTCLYLIDTLGELPVCYAAADIAFVGGSLVPVGGHNMLEPASLGVPVITGSHYFNFLEITGILRNEGAAWIVENASQLGEQVVALIEDPNLRYKAGECGRAIVARNCGGVDDFMHLLDGYLTPPATH